VKGVKSGDQLSATHSSSFIKNVRRMEKKGEQEHFWGRSQSPRPLVMAMESSFCHSLYYEFLIGFTFES